MASSCRCSGRPHWWLLLLPLLPSLLMTTTTVAFAWTTAATVGGAGGVRRPFFGRRRWTLFQSCTTNRWPAQGGRAADNNPHLSQRRPSLLVGRRPLFQQSSSAGGDTTTTTTTASTASSEEEIDFSQAEIDQVEQFLETIRAAAAGGEGVGDEEEDKDGDDSDESDTILQTLPTLPTLPAGLLLKLRQTDSEQQHSKNPRIAEAAAVVNRTLRDRLQVARQTLKELLEAGELRRLDALIGKAARQNRLDAAFFNVLTVNLEDAAAKRENEAEEEDAAAAAAAAESDEASNDDETATTSRLQILQHVYTRCQEEVEKLIPPGTALLNKLLRTDAPSIRANLYQHYLAPQSATSTITTPDGKTVELKPQQPQQQQNQSGDQQQQSQSQQQSRVPLSEFVDAVQRAVLQIRQVEAAGGVDRAGAAMMVESLRTVSKEARACIGQAYGADSSELRAFESNLQPVFRPRSADSPYVTGGGDGESGGETGVNATTIAATASGASSPDDDVEDKEGKEDE